MYHTVYNMCGYIQVHMIKLPCVCTLQHIIIIYIHTWHTHQFAAHYAIFIIIKMLYSVNASLAHNHMYQITIIGGDQWTTVYVTFIYENSHFIGSIGDFLFALNAGVKLSHLKCKLQSKPINSVLLKHVHNELIDTVFTVVSFNPQYCSKHNHADKLGVNLM